MSRVSIIMHSVGGNVYIIGSYLAEILIECGIDARLYRVEDSDLHIKANESDAANDFLEEIMELPIAKLETLKKSDGIILGSPTRFGNMTAELKAFLDTTFSMSEERELEGRLFACFTTCAHSVCEGSHALDSMLYWAQNMGLIHIPFGVHKELQLSNQPVCGIVHLEGKESVIRPSDKIGSAIETYARTIASFLDN